MVRLLLLNTLWAIGQSGDFLCGAPPPAPQGCHYVCQCSAYPYQCRYVLVCPSLNEEGDDG